MMAGRCEDVKDEEVLNELHLDYASEEPAATLTAKSEPMFDLSATDCFYPSFSSSLKSEDSNQSSFSYADSSSKTLTPPPTSEDASVSPAKTAGSRRRKRKAASLQQAHQRQAANMRERRRMQSINEAFDGLRAHIPTLPYEKRLSKVDTLRLAIGYINFLREIIHADAGAKENSGGSTMPPEPPRKVLLHCHPSMYELAQCPENYPQVTAHSLGWYEERHCLQAPSLAPQQHSPTIYGKLWIPEDPRGKCKQELGVELHEAELDLEQSAGKSMHFEMHLNQRLFPPYQDYQEDSAQNC